MICENTQVFAAARWLTGTTLAATSMFGIFMF
jgi:hypothetical protein